MDKFFSCHILYKEAENYSVYYNEQLHFTAIFRNISLFIRYSLRQVVESFKFSHVTSCNKYFFDPY